MRRRNLLFLGIVFVVALVLLMQSGSISTEKLIGDRNAAARSGLHPSPLGIADGWDPGQDRIKKIEIIEEYANVDFHVTFGRSQIDIFKIYYVPEAFDQMRTVLAQHGLPADVKVNLELISMGSSSTSCLGRYNDYKTRSTGDYSVIGDTEVLAALVVWEQYFSDRDLNDPVVRRLLYNTTSVQVTQWTLHELGHYPHVQGQVAPYIAEPEARELEKFAASIEPIFWFDDPDAYGIHTYHGEFFTVTSDAPWPWKDPTAHEIDYNGLWRELAREKRAFYEGACGDFDAKDLFGD